MTLRSIFRSVAAILLPVLLAACTLVPTAAYIPGQKMNDGKPLDEALLDARASIEQASLHYYKQHVVMNDENYEIQLSDFQISQDGQFATAVYSINGIEQTCKDPVDWWLGSGPQTDAIYQFDQPMPLPNGKPGHPYFIWTNALFSNCNFTRVLWIDLQSAKRFMDAMTLIKKSAGPGFQQTLLLSALVPDTYPYRTSVLSSATTQLSLQARTAVGAGRIDDGIMLYKNALELAPTWPAGHYDLAMLYADKGHYGDAVNEMNTYLALLPNAPNAAAAEKRVVQWQTEGSTAQ